MRLKRGSLRTLLRMPGLCASCGSNNPTHEWEVESEISRSYVVVRKTEKYKFSVPVCARCYASLEKAERRGNYLSIALVGLGILAGVVLVIINSYDWPFIFLPGFGGLVLAGLAHRIVTDRNMVAEYTGSSYWFCSDAFRQRFKELNLHAKVNPSRYWMD